MNDTLELMARAHVDCGDGSTMELRNIVALGLIKQSQMDDIQDELTDVDAIKAAYGAIKSAAATFMDATREPSEAMLNLLNDMMGGNDEGLTARWQAMHDQLRKEAFDG